MNEILNAFGHDNAAELTWLQDNCESNSFAGSLFDQLQSKGSLSERQVSCIRNNLQNAKPKANGVSIKGEGLTSLIGAFTKAQDSGLKSPRLRITGLTFSLAGINSVNSGCLYVKNKDRLYLGKITRDGEYFASHDADKEQRSLVSKVGANPLEQAVAHGQQTGNCACCGRELTKQESIDRGIGPVCASKWGW